MGGGIGTVVINRGCAREVVGEVALQGLVNVVRVQVTVHERGKLCVNLSSKIQQVEVKGVFISGEG